MKKIKFYIKKKNVHKPFLKFGNKMTVKEKDPAFVAVAVEDEFVHFEEKEQPKIFNLFDGLPVDTMKILEDDLAKKL